MKLYELSVLFHPDLEMNLDQALAKVKAIITTGGGEVIKEDNAGKRRLAYAIDGQDFAVYVYMDIRLPAESLKKVQSTLNITDEVIRYLLVTVDEKARLSLAESKQREQSDTQSEE